MKWMDMTSSHALGQLIEAAQNANGWSDRDLADRAGRMQFDMAKSNFSRLKNQPLVSIKGSLIKGLAQVLAISEAKVAQAALVSMGVEVSQQQPSMLDALSATAELSERDRRLLAALLDALRSTSQNP